MNTTRVPFLISCLGRCLTLGRYRRVFYQTTVLILTYIAYTSYHLSRRPLAVVKNSLNQDCTLLVPPAGLVINDSNRDSWCDWEPFHQSDANKLLGILDSSYIFSYAVFMFVSGTIAERFDLRYYLSIGMSLSALFTFLFGLGFYMEIHSFAYFVVVQVISGIVQSTGWPAVVACVANWFGKTRRGLIFGIWNSHLYVGNILGAYVAGHFVATNWGLAFVVPAVIIAVTGLLQFLFLVPSPADVDCSLTEYDDDVSVPQAVRSQSPKTADLPSAEVDLLYGTRDITVDETSPLITKVATTRTFSSSGKTECKDENPSAITFYKALTIPGVAEFSLCLFFSKLVSYTFLFWLPRYIAETTGEGTQFSAYLSIAFDIGGILGGILAGALSDVTRASALTCVGFFIFSIPVLFLYEMFGSHCEAANITLMIICGAFVNGPYALITTAVSAELGTHRSLRGNSKALATVTAIIDGTGSIGAAVGPLVTGILSQSSWTWVFYMMMASNFLALLCLARIAINEFKRLCWRDDGWCSFLPSYSCRASQCCKSGDSYEEKIIR